MYRNIEAELEDVSCCIGCAENDEVMFHARDLLHDLPGLYHVVRCRTCGLIRTNPRPTKRSICDYYPDDYGPYLDSVVRDGDLNSMPIIKRIFKPLVNRIFNFNGTPLPQLTPGRMLEVGCASGSYLYKMAKMGWQVQGIELNEKAAQAARKLGYCVYVGPLETAPRPEIAFDLIVGWMVLEHLHDPVAGLMKLNSWAKPDAWLVLSIPNAGSLEFRLFEDKWYALQVPTHMHHFTSQSIAKVLRAGGWQLETVIHQRTLSNFIGSLGYVLRDKGYTFIGEKLIEFPQRGGRLAYLLYPLCWLLSLFGQTGRMTVWAKKL